MSFRIPPALQAVLTGIWYGVVLGVSYYLLDARLGEGFVYRIF